MVTICLVSQVLNDPSFYREPSFGVKICEKNWHRLCSCTEQRELEMEFQKQTNVRIGHLKKNDNERDFMKLVSKTVVAAAACVLFTGCVGGNLQVDQSITLKARKGKKVELSPGNSKANISFKHFFGKRNLILKVDGQKKVRFKVPKGTQFPSFEGELFLSSDQTGQDYDIYSSVNTDVFNGPIRNYARACGETRFYRQCVINEQGERTRVRKSYYLRGSQVVYAYNQTTTKYVYSELSSSGDQVAKFNGQNTSTREIIDHADPCHIRPVELRRLRRLRRQGKQCVKANP